MTKEQKELLQISLNSEKEVLQKLTENYKDALSEIETKIAILQGRSDADLQHVIYQVEYQKALKTQVQAILETLQNNNFETVSDYLTTSYEEGFIGTLYELQGQGIPLMIPIDQEMVVAAIQHETQLSESLYATLGKDTKLLSKQIAGEISRGITNGAMYSEIGRNIAGYAGISKNNAMRIARTEAHRIQNKAISDAQHKAKDRGADIVKIWSAALDGRTRDTHRKLDGQIRELDEPFEVDGKKAQEPGGFGLPEEDINCRCRRSSKARWLLGEQETKYIGNTSKMSDEDLEPIAAKIGISVDDLRQYSDEIIPVKAKNYADFKRRYDKIYNYRNYDAYKQAQERISGVRNGEERVRPSVQKMKPLENGGKSSKIKSITVDYVKEAIEGSEIKPEVADYISSVLGKKNAMGMFDKVRTIEVKESIVMNTNVEQFGTFGDIVLELNVNALGGKSIEEIDSMFIGAGNTVANSFEDAITHEKYHADLIFGKNYSQIESLYAKLEDVHIDSFSKTAYKDGTECIAEVGVMIDRGDADKVPKDAMALFIEYMGNRL